MIISNAKDFVNEKKKNITKSQIAGIVLFVLATIGYLGLFIGFLGFLKSFILGLSGVLSYGLYFIFYFFAINLVRNKKFKFTNKQIVYAVFSLLSILAIFHIAFFENTENLSYLQYLGLTYTSKTSVGGLLFSLFVYPIVHYIKNVGAYLVFGILLVVFVGLLIDSFNKGEQVVKSKIKTQNNVKDKPKVISIPIDFDRRMKEIKLEKDLEFEENRNNNLGVNGEIEEQPLTSKQIAMKKLGLDDLDNKRQEYLQSVSQGDFGFINGYSPSLVKEKAQDNSFTQKPKMINHVNGENTQDTNKNYNDLSREEKNKMFLAATLNRPFNANKQNEELETIKSNIEGVNNIPRTGVFNDLNEKSSPKFVYEDSPLKKETNLQFSKDENVAKLDNKENKADLFDLDLNTATDFDLKELELPESLKANNDRRRINPNILNSAPVITAKTESDSINNTDFKPKESFEKKFEQETISQEQREYNASEVLSSSSQTEIQKPQVYVKPPMYIRPSMDLLINTSTNPEEYGGNYTQKAQNIEERLSSFNINAKVKNVTCGPQVTRYELEMPLGVSVNKVVTYQNDIAASVASNHGVRIEAPIPGKNAVGVEVPNDKIATVSLKEVLDSPEFFTSKSLTTFALGKAIDGSLKVCDLSSMPHVVVAGSTGSGKSVCLNSLIVSILFRAGPEDVKFILIDPKMVEFSLFNGLPHLILPKAITDVDKAVNALKWVAEEMDRRYLQLSVNQVKKIEEYNELPEIVEGKKAKMPYIVVVVDEVADLMSQNKKEVENYVARIAAKARAAGIHLVLATQRPSVDVITGTIKNNLPSRIAFAVTSQVDSRTILDRVGAENLLGRGDLLYINSTMSEPMRYQGCFVSNKEVKAVCDFIRENNKCDYDENIAAEINKSKSAGGADGSYDENYELDPYFKHALKLVIEAGGASTSLLQRKFRWGYQRSARVIDQMEEKGYIGAVDGSKPRAVYLSLEDYYKLFGND